LNQPGSVTTSIISFEQPLNERVRTFLRLEFLFAQHKHYRTSDRSSWGNRGALHALLDILTLVSRSDIKAEIIKELADQQAALTRLKARPGVDPGRLNSVLNEITSALNAMQTLSSQFIAGALRDNEFLISVLHRSTIPGGTCVFDLPAYHFWLSRREEQVRRDLDAWFSDLKPYEFAIGLLLRLLRSSTEAIAVSATGGVYLYSPTATFSLVRVLVSPDYHVYPEISAGRHRFTIRFMSLKDVNARNQQSGQDIPFQLQCCVL
jgi:cell division protein ZapD